MPKTKGVITRIETEAPNVKLFYIKPEQKIPFKNGQHLIIFMKDGKYHVGRPYSITTTPEEEEIGFCIKLYPGGKLTSYLFERKVGDEVLLSQAFGRLTLRDENKPLVFLATGTGIAPVVSILEGLLKKGAKQKIHVLFGAMTEKNIIYNDKMWNWANNFKNFYFVPCLSNPSQEWKGRRGYVQNNLDAVPNWIENDWYIVGIHAMVEDCKKTLLEAGIPENQIFTETE